jgi:hypothetical protein
MRIAWPNATMSATVRAERHGWAFSKNSARSRHECCEFLAPYLAAAKLTGEVRKDLDVPAAGEWFARMLFSLFSTPSSTLNMDDDEVVADFVRSHVVRGFTNDRAGRSR